MKVCKQMLINAGNNVPQHGTYSNFPFSDGGFK